jgi:hypothetical protein
MAVVRIIAGVCFLIFGSMDVQDWAIPQQDYKSEQLREETRLLIEKH